MRRVLAGCALLLQAAAQAATVYVAPDGDDRAEGSRRHPLQTVNAALDRLRAKGQTSGGTVRLHDGAYVLGAPIALDANDSGTAEAPLIIEAERNAAPRLIGGVRILPERFTAATDPDVVARLVPAARGAVVFADVEALGFAEAVPYPNLSESPPVTPELFFGGERQTVAKWPNEGWGEVAEVVESGPAPWRNHASDKLPVFRYDGDEPARWRVGDGVWLQGYWCFDWHIETVKIASIDAAAHTITLAVPPVYGVGSGNPAKRRFVALNVLEELDAPGEYCLDWAAHRVYFWPPADLASKETVLSRVRGAMIDIKDAAHVTLRGLTVEMGQELGIRVQGGEDVRIEDCVVRNMGLQGIDVDGGKNHSVFGCEISNTGTGGLRIAGGDRPTLTPSGHRVENNHIHHVGRRQRTHADHVDIGGVGVYFAHNLLHDGPHQCIYVGGNDHIIEYNEVHHVGMDSDDCGAYYMGRNPSERGNIIRYNYWHDLGSTFAHGSCAIYLDDGESGQQIYGNVFYRAAGGSFGAIFNHGGHDNVAERNIFIECKRAIGASPWNDAGWREWVDGDLWKQRLLKEVDITSALYTSRYPELAHFYQWEGTPRRNRAVRNVFYRCDDAINGNWDGTENVTPTDDLGLRVETDGTFSLRCNAKYLRRLAGFEDVPFDKMGLKR